MPAIVAAAFFILLLVILFPWLMTMFVITKQKHIKVIETFGKFSGIRQAGLSFKAPWPFQSSSANFSMQLRPLSEEVGVKSSNNAFVTIPIHIQYRVNAETAEAAYYSLQDPETQIRSYIVNQVRATGSGKTFDELFQSRDTFKQDVTTTLASKLEEFGYIIEDVLVDDPQPSKELRVAFDRVLASERLREAAKNEGEAAKTLSVAKAEAEGQALKIRGKAFAEFRKTIATGFGDALDDMAGQTGLPREKLLDALLDINEKEAITNAAHSGGKIVYVGGQGRQSMDTAALAMLGDSLKTASQAHAPAQEQQASAAE